MFSLVYSWRSFTPLPTKKASPSCDTGNCPPDLATLRAKAKQLTLAAHYVAPHKFYEKAWCLFGEDLKLYQKDLNNLQELDLVEFIAFPAIAEMAGECIHSYVSGIKHHFKIWSLSDFSTSFALALVLKGLSNTNNCTDVRISINLGMLNHMCSSLQQVVASLYLVALYSALFCIAFHGLFHPGELT